MPASTLEIPIMGTAKCQMTLTIIAIIATILKKEKNRLRLLVWHHNIAFAYWWVISKLRVPVIFC